MDQGIVGKVHANAGGLTAHRFLPIHRMLTGTCLGLRVRMAHASNQ